MGIFPHIPSCHAATRPTAAPGPQEQQAVNFSYFLINRGLPLLSHHLAGSAVKKTDATAALFTALVPKPCSVGSRGGGQERRREAGAGLPPALTAAEMSAE